MKKIGLFDCISPLDFRYYGNDKTVFKKASEFLSENARIRYQARVEAALVKALAKEKVCSREVAIAIQKASEKVSAEEVYAEEKKTKHDVRALVNCIRKRVGKKAKSFVHLGATSYDIVDTANALRYKETIEKLLLPSLRQLEKNLIRISLKNKKVLQIGRTHGQHAEPITFGFAIASYVSRLGNRIQEIERAKNNLRGKLSGAVGAYNALTLLIKNPIEFEKEVLKELGLKPSVSSTQIVEPEALVDLIHAIVSTLSVLANFSDDMRNLQRSEIAEVAEFFAEKQVGSSTMPHKRNPINFENVKSFFKQFMPRAITAYLDQISEHQRDLTNSASQRFVPELLLALYLSTERLNKVLKRLAVDKENLKKNFEKSKNLVLAEPLYILLAFYGYPNAHEHVKKLTLKAERTGENFWEIVKKDKSLTPYLKKFSKKHMEVLQNPEKYTGKAVEKTEKVCKHWKKKLRI